MLEVKIKKALPGFNLEVDFSIKEEILVILGPSGSGKTMTLKCIAGLLRPDEGHIKLNGKALFDSVSRINLPAQQRKVGFVFQNYALFPHLTVNENTAYGIRHWPKHEVNRPRLVVTRQNAYPGAGATLSKAIIIRTTAESSTSPCPIP